MESSNVLVFRDVKITSIVPESSLGTWDISKPEPEFVSVKQIAQIYGISKSLLYELIQTEKNFPSMNVGKKKRFVIHLKGFKEWLNNRQRVKDSQAPTALELIRRHRK